MRRGRAADYRVAVPSYLRPDMLTDLTLPVLVAGGVDPARVTVFIHGHDSNGAAYRAAAAAAGVDLVVTDRRGITAQRAAIIDHYPPGTPLVQVDDDLTAVVQALNSKTTRPVADLDGFLRGMFLDTAGRDLWVWGLAPTTNAFYMSPGRLSEGLKFCIATVLGCFTRPGHPVHGGTVQPKEDYELSLRAWWYDGAVLRNDGAAAAADHYGPGGCTDLRTTAAETAAAETLVREWPGLVRHNTRRRSEFTEVLLAPKPRHAGHPPTAPLPGALTGVSA